MLHGDQVQHTVTVPRPCKCYTETKLNTLSQYLDPANATRGPSSTQRVTVPRPCKCYTGTKFNTTCHSTLTLQMLHGDQVQHNVSQYLDPANATIRNCCGVLF
ncbi:hypothetical protein STEG23_016626 [Scotinomys teguina]